MMKDSEETLATPKRQVNQNGWLNLSFQPSNGTDSDFGQALMNNKPSNSASKLFSCKFCTRKFCSSQALGGHQNGHKRERGTARRYQFQRIMAMMGLPPSTNNAASCLMVRSLVVRPHSLLLLQRPNRAGHGQQIEPPPPPPTQPLKLDLNLKLY